MVDGGPGGCPSTWSWYRPYRSRKAPHLRPLFPVVAWQRNGRTVLWGLSHLCSRFWARLALGPYACSISFLSIIVPIPWFLCPLYRPKFHPFVPQEKKSARCCRLESLRDPGFIAHNLAFYRPQKAQTDISLVNKCITSFSIHLLLSIY